MSLSVLQKFFVLPVIIFAGVFSAMSFPIATLGDKQINIKFQEEPIIYGKLRDVAIPYVVLASLLSMGTALSTAAFSGWQDSSRKSVKFQQELFSLEQSLQEKEALLQELKLSDSRLQVSGLKAFLDDDMPLNQALSHNTSSTTKFQSITKPQSVTVQTQAQVYEQPVNSVPHIEAQKNITKPVRTVAAISGSVPHIEAQENITKPVRTVADTSGSVPHIEAQENITKPVRTVAATSGFASAQSFLGYAQTNVNNIKENVLRPEEHQITITPFEFQELQKQLREMMFQMQTMQDNMRVKPQPTNAEAKVADRFRVYYDTVSMNEVQSR